VPLGLSEDIFTKWDELNRYRDNESNHILEKTNGHYLQVQNKTAKP
ncbi:hypothetical protein EGK_16814, partial [Macaca mulatta]